MTNQKKNAHSTQNNQFFAIFSLSIQNVSMVTTTMPQVIHSEAVISRTFHVAFVSASTGVIISLVALA